MVSGTVTDTTAPVPPIVRAPSVRVALCIGNSAYRHSPLANPVHDATDFAAHLRRRLDFRADVARNVNKRGMEVAFERFLDRIQPGSTVVLSFHGHGCEVGGINYLMPIVRGGAMSDADLRHRGMDAQWMQMRVWERQPAFLLFILDACRSNPYSGTRSAGGGLAAMKPLGSLLLYACAPGCVALDGYGRRNSPFTTHLIQHIHRGEVHSAVRQVSRDVHRTTEGRQRPWHHSDMMADHYLGEREPSVKQLSDELTFYTVQRQGGFIVALMEQYWPKVGLQQGALVALQGLADDAAIRRQVVLADGFKAIEHVMRQHPWSVELQEEACKALSAFAIDASMHPHIASAGCIQSIVAAMKQHSSKVSLQRLACKTLADLVLRSDCYELIASAGGVSSILAAMKQHPSDGPVQEHTCDFLRRIPLSCIQCTESTNSTTQPVGSVARFLRRLAGAFQAPSKTHSTPFKALTWSTVTIECVIAAMQQHASNARVQAYACEALCTIWQCFSYRRFVSSAGSVRSIVTAMHRHPSDLEMQCKACWALHALANDELMCERIVSAGGIERIVGALTLAQVDNSVQVVAFRVLTRLARHEVCHARLVSARAIDFVLAVLKLHSADRASQRSALSVLQALALHESMHHHLLSAGAIECIVAVMKQHPPTSEMQCKACQALASLVCRVLNRRRMVAAGAIECVVAAMRHLTEADPPLLQMSACDVLAGLAADECNRPCITSFEAVQCIVASMKHYASEVKLQQKACCALSYLIRDSFGRQQLVSANGIQCVAAALTQHMSVASLQSDGLRMLSLLAGKQEVDDSIVSAGSGELLRQVKLVQISDVHSWMIV